MILSESPSHPHYNHLYWFLSSFIIYIYVIHSLIYFLFPQRTAYYTIYSVFCLCGFTLKCSSFSTERLIIFTAKQYSMVWRTVIYLTISHWWHQGCLQRSTITNNAALNNRKSLNNRGKCKKMPRHFITWGFPNDFFFFLHFYFPGSQMLMLYCSLPIVQGHFSSWNYTIK